jgi:hypothetical protein
MSRPLYGCRQLSLVLITISGSSSGNNLSLLRKETHQSFFISEIDKYIASLTKAANTFFSL